jgi:hypothetical protein
MQLTCQEVVELVTELSSGALSPEDRARLEQHLLVCPPCTLYVGQVRATIEMVGGLRAGTPAPETSAALVDIFRRWSRK